MRSQPQPDTEKRHLRACSLATVWSSWGMNGAFNRPPMSQESRVQQGAINAENPRPLGACMRLPIVGKQFPSSASSINGLVLRGAPPTIFRFVIAGRIYPIDGMSTRGALAHIGVEVDEAVPAFTHLNSSCSVVLIAIVFRVVAALVHAIKDVVLGSAATSVSSVYNSRNWHVHSFSVNVLTRLVHSLTRVFEPLHILTQTQPIPDAKLVLCLT